MQRSQHFEAKQPKNEKKLQPLFKKRFDVDPESHKEPENPVSAAKPPEHSKLKSRAFNEEDLEIKIKKLKSEKLEVFKDLCSYSDKYANELCMRSRVNNILGISQSLFTMSNQALEDIQQEKALLEFLDIGLHELRNSSNIDVDASESQQTNDLRLEIAYGLPFCIHKNEVNTPFLTEPLLSDSKGQFLQIVQKNGAFYANFSNKKETRFKILEKPRAPEKYYLFEIWKEEGVKLQVDAEQGPVCIEIVDNELEDYFNNKDIRKISDFIRHKIALASDTLVWMHFGGELDSALEECFILDYTPPTSSRFDDFDDCILEGDVKVIGNSFHVTLKENKVLELFRIQVQCQDRAYDFREEDHRSEFQLLRYVENEIRQLHITLFKSLELESCVRRLIKI